MNRELYIAGIGMITPLGPDAVTNVSATQAGLCAYDASPYMDQHGQPITMALVPEDALPEIASHLSLGRYTRWHKHLLRMAHIGVEQAMADYASAVEIPIIVNLPESRDCGSKALPTDFVEKLAQQCQCSLSLQNQRILSRGRAGVIETLALAEKMLYEKGFDQVLIGGVDSYQLPERLTLLDSQARLAGPGSLDGFTPAEGACFLRLSRHRQDSLFEHARLLQPSITNEPGHFYGDGDYLGDGLAAAVAESIGATPQNSIRQVWVSANGERYWSKEIGVSLIRSQHLLHDNLVTQHPAEFFGDLGAATGAVLIALAAATQPTVSDQLICCASDGALRGAVLLSHNPAIDSNSMDIRSSISLAETE